MNGVANGVYGGDLPNQINTPWIDFSEQSTIVGWSSFTLKEIRYKVIGKMLIIVFGISGTSNSTTASFTTPFNIGSLNALSLSNIIRVTNNNAPFFGYCPLTKSSNNLVFRYFGSYGTENTSWTSSGVKSLHGQIIIEID